MDTPSTKQAPPPPVTSAPSAPTPAPSDSDSSTNRRKGKVARLPKDIRELINVMLADGVTYRAIAGKIAEHGYRLSPDSLSNWYAGGYQDWLKHQGWLEEMRARLDFASEIVQENNSELIDSASLRVAVMRMYRLLLAFDPAVLCGKIAEQPGAYARLLSVLCKLTDEAVKLERRREEKARQKSRQL